MAATSSMDAALGAVLGAAVGESCGSYLEFERSIPSSDVEDALSMPGGGPWELLPGQLTDDTELALALAHGLLESAQPVVPGMRHAGLPASTIARWYGKWKVSPAFDIGYTCRTSMGGAVHMTAEDDASDAPAEACMRLAHKSMDSKANGALMRLTPLPVLYHRLADDDVAALAAADALLSHPNPTCQLANALYATAIARLIRSPGDIQGALAALDSPLTSLPLSPSSGAASARQQVQSWLDAAEAAAAGGAPLEECESDAGYVKHAFTRAVYHLRKGTSYEEAMRQTLQGGGDTDTNGAIVGGLIGAAVGAGGIPERMKRPVLACEPSTGAQPRPEWLWPTQIPSIVERLFNKLKPAEEQ